MAILEINTPNDGTPYYDQRVLLDGVTYTLALKWSTRRSVWTLDLYNQPAGEWVLRNQVVTTAGNLLRRRGYSSACPPGVLACLAGNALDAPGFGDLGSTHRLYYFDAAEVAAA